MRLHRIRSTERSYKRWLYGFMIPLVIIGAIGYGYWKANPPVAIAAPAFSEQNYYSQLVYAVNEMNNQVEKYDQHGEWTPEEVREGRAYVETLMTPLTAPPEELSVAQAIAEDVLASYRQFTGQLNSAGSAESAILHTATQQTRHHVELFRQNAKLMTLLNSYKGVNIYCH